MKKILVLYGGNSSEREISLLSGKAVGDALILKNFDVSYLDTRQGDIKKAAWNADCVFIALHGRYGEDGQLQMLLEEWGIPFTGSGSLACHQAMDKWAAQRAFREAGLLTSEATLYTQEQVIRLKPEHYPVFVKPVMGGSSIGVSCVESEENLMAACRLAFEEDNRILVEKAIAGREMAIGILGDRPLPLIEIKPQAVFYDYEAKYQSAGTAYVSPDDLSDEAVHRIQHDALTAHGVLGCEAFSRVDVIVNEKGVHILEVNAIPGLTEKSLLPKAALAMGMGFTDLCVKMIENSIEVKRSSVHGQAKA